MSNEQKAVKEYAVENKNSLGTVRLIECYTQSTAQTIADSANVAFKKAGSKTRSLVVKV